MNFVFHERRHRLRKSMPTNTARQNSTLSLLYITAEDWFFKSHFAHLGERAQQAGYEVSVACRISEDKPLRQYGFTLYPQRFKRGNRTALHILQALPRLISTLKKARPDLIHIIGLQTMLFAAPMAALFSKAQIVLAPTGLGQFWIENGLNAKLARGLVRLLVRCFRSERFFYVFENSEDAAALGLQNYPRLKIVGGAGVDENEFIPLPMPPAPPVRVAIVSRMLKAKGIAQSVEALRRARQAGYDITLDLWGAPDPANASSLTETELRALSHDFVTWHGATDDVKSVWKNSHIAMLLSLREGLPRSLLEAAACGRPIITSDVPGCRTLVRNNQEGLLVDLNDPDAATRALIRLAQDKTLREKFGAAARARALAGFTQKQVADDILGLYAAALS
jgi:glycosyltransferase involved in cell wall biosynthesis